MRLLLSLFVCLSCPDWIARTDDETAGRDSYIRKKKKKKTTGVFNLTDAASFLVVFVWFFFLLVYE